MPPLDPQEISLRLRLNKQSDHGKEQILSHDQASHIKLLFQSLLAFLNHHFKLGLLAEFRAF